MKPRLFANTTFPPNLRFFWVLQKSAQSGWEAAFRHVVALPEESRRRKNAANSESPLFPPERNPLGEGIPFAGSQHEKAASPWKYLGSELNKFCATRAVLSQREPAQCKIKVYFWVYFWVYFLSSAPYHKVCGEHLSDDSGGKVGG